jgi:hypothetical protein
LPLKKQGAKPELRPTRYWLRSQARNEKPAGAGCVKTLNEKGRWNISAGLLHF